MSRRPTRNRRSAWLVAFAALMAASSTLPAQTLPAAEEGNLVFGQRGGRKEPTFWLAPVYGSLRLQGTYYQTHTSSGGTDTDTKERYFEEALTLSTNGYIKHPNLVELNLSITGGLTQDHFEVDDASEDSNGTLWGWDIGATFMRNEPSSGTIYSRRSESTSDIPFGGTQRVTTTETGGIYKYRNTHINSQIQAYRMEDDQSSFSLNPGYKQTRDVLTGFGDARLSDRQTLNWNFTLENDTYESGGYTNDQQSINAGLSHTLQFGDEGASTLDSSLYYSDQSGLYDSRDIRWLEHLHLWHNRNLESNYNYIYDQQNQGGGDIVTQTLTADVRHQLYDSLATTGAIAWTETSSDTTTITTYLASLTEAYQKKVPLGLLFVDLTLARRVQDFEGSGTIAVANQPVEFTGLTPITVSQPSAIPSSVLLRDATTGRIYQEGTDYTVGQTPLGLEINRVLGGNIAPGSPLLLNYDYEPLDANTVTTDTLALSTRYQILRGPLSGLTPFFRFLAQNQDISGGTAQANNVRNYAVGATYQLEEWTFLGERDWYDSTIYPYEAWRGEARWTHRLSDNTVSTLTGIYSQFDYHDPDQSTHTYSVNAGLTHRLTTHLTMTLYAAYANVQSDVGGQTTGWEQGLQADWWYRDTRVYLKVRNSSLETDESDQNYQYLQIGYKRVF